MITNGIFLLNSQSQLSIAWRNCFGNYFAIPKIYINIIILQIILWVEIICNGAIFLLRQWWHGEIAMREGGALCKRIYVFLLYLVGGDGDGAFSN